MVIPEVQNHFINWRDGMKITQSHLSAHDLAIRDAIRDVASLHTGGFNFGLLPAENGQEADLRVSVIGDNFQLNGCRAVTPGGLRIDWQAGKGSEPLSISLLDYKNRMGNAGFFYIVLRASINSLVESGDYDSDELPLRKPFRVIKPTLELLSAHETIADGFSIPIFRIRSEGQLFSPDYDYIPPSIGVFGENMLWYFDTCGKLINNIHQTAILTLRKINAMPSPSVIAKDIAQVLERIVSIGIDVIDPYRLYLKDQPPVFFISSLVKYARAIRVAFDCLSESSATRLYQYFRNNIGGTTKFNRHIPEVTKSFLDSMTDTVLSKTYNHNDCALLLDSLRSFLDFLDFLLQSLFELPYVETAARWDIA